VKGAWVPERGDVIWLNFTPNAGHEQAGMRPALVVSRTAYNRNAGLCVVFPITSKSKGYPFEIKVPAGLSVAGFVLADQCRTVDWRQRQAAFLAKAPAALMKKTLERFVALVSE